MASYMQEVHALSPLGVRHSCSGLTCLFRQVWWLCAQPRVRVYDSDASFAPTITTNKNDDDDDDDRCYSCPYVPTSFLLHKIKSSLISKDSP